MKKLLWAMLLTLGMVLALLPTTSITAIAAPGDQARIGTTYYITLQDAIDAVGNNQTITLL